eukprot:6213746-Pleurochrysis_carterae.AAC.2
MDMYHGYVLAVAPRPPGVAGPGFGALANSHLRRQMGHCEHCGKGDTRPLRWKRLASLHTCASEKPTRNEGIYTGIERKGDRKSTKGADIASP